MKKRDYKTLAWVIAAEGHIGFNHNRNSYCPVMEVGNAKEEFILKVQKMVGLGNIYSWEDRRFDGRYSNWRLTNMKDIRQILVNIFPYLPIKYQVANHIINFCTSRMSKKEDGRKHRNYTDYELYCVNRVKELNKRRKPVVDRANKLLYGITNEQD